MTLTEALKEQMNDETFKKEYEFLEPEYELIRTCLKSSQDNRYKG